MPKSLLRSQLLAERHALTHSEWSQSSQSAQLSLLSLNEYLQAKCVALYASVRNETDTKLIFHSALDLGKRILYPVVCDRQMIFRNVERLELLQKGAFGILEPPYSGIEQQTDEADLIIVPGVAFDLSGHRIGYGKGFYDRFLHHTKHIPYMIGLCHDFQLLEEAIPVDIHDIPMNMIVTNTRIIRVQQEDLRE